MYICKFCGKKQKHPLSKKLCVSCYQYFILHDFKTFTPSKYGQLDFVTDKTSNQYGMPICHICGKAYTKLQQHIWYTHHLSKKDYCDLFGLDRKIRMTNDEYNQKMRDYAYKYKMDEQVKRVGKNTRFQKGKVPKYNRSYQTQKRLKLQGNKIAIRKEEK